MNWDEWRGSLDGRKTMLIKRLIALFGCRIDLHKFVANDDRDCFHTHPAWAIRIILRGYYVEQLEQGGVRAWFAGDISIVRPELSHRIDHISIPEPLSLWIRGPSRAKIELRGTGWPKR